jgi:hypothetical protein
MAERGQMAISKNKGSVAYSIQGSFDAPVKDAESKMQAAVEVLIQSIIEGADSIRRT